MWFSAFIQFYKHYQMIYIFFYFACIPSFNIYSYNHKQVILNTLLFQVNHSITKDSFTILNGSMSFLIDTDFFIGCISICCLAITVTITVNCLFLITMCKQMRFHSIQQKLYMCLAGLDLNARVDRMAISSCNSRISFARRV